MTVQKHTPGPITAKLDAGNHQWQLLGEDHSCIIGRLTSYLIEGESYARLLAASYNAFDSAAARLNLNAVELAERMQDGGIADLVEALRGMVAEYADSQGDLTNSLRVDHPCAEAMMQLARFA